MLWFPVEKKCTKSNLGLNGRWKASGLLLLLTSSSMFWMQIIFLWQRTSCSALLKLKWYNDLVDVDDVQCEQTSIQATQNFQGIFLIDVNLFVTDLKSILDLLDLVRGTRCFKDLNTYEIIYRGCNCWVLNQKLIYKLPIERGIACSKATGCWWNGKSSKGHLLYRVGPVQHLLS